MYKYKTTSGFIQILSDKRQWYFVWIRTEARTGGGVVLRSCHRAEARC